MDLQKIIDGTYVDTSSSYNGSFCWIWLHGKSYGYGRIWADGEQWATHRYAYCCVNGEIPDDLIVRHMCHKKACCNPDHLKAGTSRDNWWDSAENNYANIERRRKVWIIAGVQYRTLHEAARVTGISHITILKYTRDGVFDIDAYRRGCRRNHIPRI